MPDLKTDLLTYLEFMTATEGKTGTFIVFDIVGQGQAGLDAARDLGVWDFGDQQLVAVADHLDGYDCVGRIGGDLFAIFTEGDAVEVDAIQRHLNLCPVEVRHRAAQTLFAANAALDGRTARHGGC